MFDPATFSVFLAAAFVLAITPGPGIFYVLARSIKGGRQEGVESTVGTAIGGLGHVVGAALGLSALLASSAAAFASVKYAGAAYLIYLGVRTLASSDEAPSDTDAAASRDNAIVQGAITELLNPKTALFFLAFIPQFIDPASSVFSQFVILGMISVALNSSADLVVVYFAGPLSERLRQSLRFRRRTRLASGGALIGLGAYVAFADDHQ